MDFNTGGRSERPDDDRSRPLYGGEAGGPVRGPAGGSGGEFNLSDPIGSFVDTVRGVVLDPVGFFRGIARQGNFVNPAVFALICYEISAILGGLISVVLDVAAGQRVGSSIGSFIVSLILTPIFAVIGLFIGAGILHLLVLLFVRPSNAGFEATFRVVSYASVVQLISWVPILGQIVAAVYGIVLSIFGIREVHATTTGRAALVVLIPVVVVLLLLVLFVGAALFFFFSGAGSNFK